MKAFALCWNKTDDLYSMRFTNDTLKQPYAADWTITYGDKRAPPRIHEYITIGTLMFDQIYARATDDGNARRWKFE